MIIDGTIQGCVTIVYLIFLDGHAQLTWLLLHYSLTSTPSSLHYTSLTHSFTSGFKFKKLNLLCIEHNLKW